MDPYEALGVKRTATDAEIRKAYRKIAKTCHPDLNPDDPEAEAKFKAASAAYDLLKDPEQRARYDRGEIDEQGQERAPHGFYREYAEEPGNPYRSGRTYRYTTADGGDFDFDASDIFAEFMRARAGEGADFGGFGGFERRGGGREFHARGADRRYTMEIDFLDAVYGATKRITLPDGQTLEVKIPQGTRDGQTIRLRGKGAPGIGKGPAGDALVTLTVRPHKFFTREGNDIILTLPITIDEAILGGKVPTPTISGTVNLTIPKGASSGQVLRLRGRGVQTRDGKRGDQKVILNIVSPPKVDDELADFMEKWRKTHAYDPRKGMF